MMPFAELCKPLVFLERTPAALLAFVAVQCIASHEDSDAALGHGDSDAAPSHGDSNAALSRALSRLIEDDESAHIDAMKIKGDRKAMLHAAVEMCPRVTRSIGMLGDEHIGLLFRAAKQTAIYSDDLFTSFHASAMLMPEVRRLVLARSPDSMWNIIDELSPLWNDVAFVD